MTTYLTITKASKCKQDKESVYLTMVEPQLEYASAVWDPYHVGDIAQLDKVQRRAARWVLNDYGRYGSVTLMLDHLSWPSQVSLCTLLYL